MFESRTNFVYGIILWLKRKFILGKAIVYLGQLLNRHVEKRKIEDEDKTIDIPKGPIWILPRYKAG